MLDIDGSNNNVGSREVVETLQVRNFYQAAYTLRVIKERTKAYYVNTNRIESVE